MNEMATERWDRVGAFASTMCAVHCAACAVAPAVFGLIGLELLASQQAEWGLTAFAVFFAAGALALGWRRHRSALVAGALALGMAGLIAARGMEASGQHHDHSEAAVDRASLHLDEQVPDHGFEGHGVGSTLGLMGGLFLVLGHALNIRACRACKEAGCKSE